jgi:hypothetical protein
MIGWMVAATEDTFDASGCKMATILGVSVAFAVCTLGYFPFVFRRFEFDLTLL